jgi:subtilisin family serine protease
MPRGTERRTAAWNAVVDNATTSQQPLIAIAEKLKAEGAVKSYETLVSPNMLIVEPANYEGGKKMLAAFQAAAGVKAIYNGNAETVWPPAAANAADGAKLTGKTSVGLDVVIRGAATAEAPAEAPWGLRMIGATSAWKTGAIGAGMTFGSIDTGVDYTHEAIAKNYRGRNADGTYSHDYNWYSFGSRYKTEPYDTEGHGTHTIGTVTGTAPGVDGGAPVPIGVAPEAKWISVSALNDGVDVRLKALQWMMAPTKLDGTSPDPTKAPDVVGMSWWTGPSYSDIFQESIKNLRAAGIEVTKSAGNNGPNPETGSAPGNFPEIRAIAAVDAKGDIAKFSSRGPSPLPHNRTTPAWKPDYAAPGVDVLSSVPGNRYASYSGTSMAQPHFSGALLAILSKYPNLTDAQLDTILKASVTDAGATGRDLEFGYGIVNIPAALAAAEKLVKQAK